MAGNDAATVPVNPWTWSGQLGFDQARIVTGATRHLFCSGQDSVDADGAPQHPGDMRAQLELALDNLQSVLASAQMTFADVVRLTVYTTDVDVLFQNWARIPARFGDDSGFVTSVLGVTRLASPDLLVLLEATAID